MDWSERVSSFLHTTRKKDRLETKKTHTHKTKKEKNANTAATKP